MVKLSNLKSDKAAQVNSAKVGKVVKPGMFASFDLPSATQLPEEVTDSFRAQGFDLKWVRITIRDEGAIRYDIENVRKKTHQGWVPVTKTELNNTTPGVAELFDSVKNSELKDKDWVVVGDSALFKRDSEISEAHRQYNEQKALDLIRSVNTQLGKDVGRELINESKSVRFRPGPSAAEIEDNG